MADDFFNADELVGADGESEIGLTIFTEIFDDHVDAEAGLTEVVEEGGDGLRVIGQVIDGDARLESVEGDASDGCVLKGFVDSFHESAGLVIK